MRSPETRAQDVADRLTAAAGTEARLSRSPDAIRIEVDVPVTLPEASLDAIVAVLEAADHHGHDVPGGVAGGGAGVAWAEITLRGPGATPEA